MLDIDFGRMTELNGVNFIRFYDEKHPGVEEGRMDRLFDIRDDGSIVPRKGPKFRLGMNQIPISQQKSCLQAAADPPSTTPSGKKMAPAPLELQA